MRKPLGLFEAYGIEIELMIVDSKSLDVKPIADLLLTAAAGELASDYEDGDITWSNELVSHVIEFKTTGPAPSLESLEAAFFRSQQKAQRLLAAHGARLMPTGMHPWMDPSSETVLWPHDNNEIYSLYDRIFGCRGHGWSNLQSVHINLPFANEDEFRRLHSAIRVILPIIPALAASSPVCASARTGSKDTRLTYYESNQQSIPIIAGDIIPEAVTGFSDYRKKISDPIQAATRPFDPDQLLEGDWLNSRGAIARIDRNAIEIRLLDTQECAHANIAIVQLICASIQSLVDDENFLKKADSLETKALREIWRSCVTNAETAVINDAAYISLFNSHPTGPPSQTSTAASETSAELWRSILRDRVKRFLVKQSAKLEQSPGATVAEPCSLSKNDLSRLSIFENVLLRPSLASRIESAVGVTPTREKLHQIYETLCDCLDKNEVFDPESLKTTEMIDGAHLKSSTSQKATDTFVNV
jgi:carboxylate-amine ligase